MKNIFIPIFLFFITSCQLLAQNWQPVVPGNTYYYSTCDTGILTHAIFVDSLKTVKGDTILYLNRAVNPWDSNAYYEPVPIKSFIDQPQFLQKYEFTRHDSICWFHNPYSFSIYPLAAKDQNWIFDSLNSITASIKEISFGNTKVGPDSIKIILLSIGDSIILSKNHGILYFPRLYDSPYPFFLWSISGKISAGRQIVSMAEFLKVQEGNFFEYTTYEFQPESYPTVGKIRVKVNKSVNNADSLIYITEYWKVNSTLYNSNPNSSLKHKTDTVKYAFKDLEKFDQPPRKAIFENTDKYDVSYLPSLLPVDVVPATRYLTVPAFRNNNKTMERGFRYYGVSCDQSNDQGCVGSNYIHPNFGAFGALFEAEAWYREEIGLMKFQLEMFEYSYSVRLTGYQKNGIIYGSLFPDSLFSEVDVNFTMNEPHIIPNPASRETELHLPGPPADWTISIFSIQGTPMIRLEKKNTNTVSLDVSRFPAGTYICRAILPGKSLFSIKLNVIH